MDILLIDSDGGLYSDKASEMKAFVEANTKVPTGTSYDFMAPYALLDFAKVAEEQGRDIARCHSHCQEQRRETHYKYENCKRTGG